jgi:hypothetical protein
MTKYNCPISNSPSMTDLQEHIEEIYRNSQFSFKINLSFGIILRHSGSGNFRYYTPYSNDHILKDPFLISSLNDVDRYMEKLSEMDIVNYMKLQRPDSSWKPFMLCNIVYFVSIRSQ